MAQDDRPNQEILDEMGIDEDPMYTIVGHIKDETRAMMETIRDMFSQRSNAIDSDDPNITPTPARTAELTATIADREHIETGKEMPTQTDKDREELPPEDRIRDLANGFMEAGQAEEDAQWLAMRLVEEKVSYVFSSEQLDGHMMFNVRRRSGVLKINLNTDHQVYEMLSYIEDGLDDEVDKEDPSYQATVIIRLLLSSWARMEDQTESRDDRTRIQEVAFNWGRQVDKVLRYLREKGWLRVYDKPGEELIRLCSGANSIVISAPYIKTDALMKVLNEVSPRHHSPVFRDGLYKTFQQDLQTLNVLQL